MANSRSRLTNAPIVEALIDFRVRSRADLKVETLLQAKSALVGFTKVEEIREVAVSISMAPHGDAPMAKNEDVLRGFRFATEDGKRLVHCQVDGFTYNQLAPYESGDSLRANALKAWDAYLAVARPEQVVRVAMRYINRIDVPARPFELSKYLETPAALLAASELQEEFFSYRSQRAELGTDCRAILGVSTSQNAATGGLWLTVDVDVFRIGEFGLQAESLAAGLDMLRSLKNRIFFGVISESLAARLS